MRQRFLVIFSILLVIISPVGGEPVSFNRDIRPILSENCFYCHGQDPNKRKSGLRLDVREDALKPADSGDLAIVPGSADKSGIITRIHSTDSDDLMPPPKSNRTLTLQQKEMLKRWIAEGAKYETHWAFVPPLKAPLPQVKNVAWGKNEIDRFVLAKLEAKGLEPSPEADRPTLIRRLSLDLTGLLPSPEEVDAFVADTAPDAYDKVVDRLLKSQHYGERMALPWLDAARYADSNGFQRDGDTFQWVWRDWVVRALNADMPFDRFSIEQLAGDLLPTPTNDQLVATGFNRNHLINGEGGAIPEEQRFNILFDRVDTTATNWLGLTMACAQCHDHKYDPLTQRDYYGLLASFNQVSELGIHKGAKGTKQIAEPFLRIPSAENQRHLTELESKKAGLEAAVKEQQEAAFKKWMLSVTPELKKGDRKKPLPEKLSAILKIEAGKRSAQQAEELAKGLRTFFDAEEWASMAAKDPALKEAKKLKEEITKYENEIVPRVMVMRDDKRRETHLLDRGNYLSPKEKVDFATPAFLPLPPKDAPLNRLGFARWLFQADHPLTARVQVNRMWQHFFGLGLVKTTEDLGVQSEQPVHQELLDWLSVEFRERGWSMKHLHRLIVTSVTYRQSSKVSKELLQMDPENRLMARGARFRAPSMILRDVALAASGLLDSRVGGAPVYPYQPDAIWESLAITKERDFTYPASSGSDLYRRSLYTFWRRTVGPANMFDAGNRQTCKVRQSITNTPLHALTTLNDPTWGEAARVLAAKCMKAAKATDDQITLALRRVLGRKPSSRDMTLLRKAFDKQLAIYQADPKAAASVVSIGTAPRTGGLDPAHHAALSALCLGIFNLDEALTRE